MGGHTNTSNGVGDWGEEWAGTPIQAMESGTGERNGRAHQYKQWSRGLGRGRAGTPMELGTKGGILHAISK